MASKIVVQVGLADDVSVIVDEADVLSMQFAGRRFTVRPTRFPLELSVNGPDGASMFVMTLETAPPSNGGVSAPAARVQQHKGGEW
jgi:hypothetical protein